ncbi:phospho-sugar mutase [Eremococcus coleocola]|uniref:phospho-sugar mutase n=1 Tax=Eremococcus coleocola TaxID=88132 RepID=UPI0003FF84AE|nr:phospho-sugar mutase [Eremococcus coleocola]
MTWEKNYQEWKNFETLDKALNQELSKLSETQLQDAFGSDLSFGTAGMRGVLGPGTNRMNIYTVRQATEGLAQLILDKGQDAVQAGVAIAYDSRHMSYEFAFEAARVLGFHGIKAYVYESLRPTPVLSFAVRHLKAFAGIMITASHNPAEYNGYKVYGSDGGQMVPEDADALTKYIRQIASPLTVKVADQSRLVDQGLLEILGDDLDQAYLEAIQSVTINPNLIKDHADMVNIVYTPLHGTGLYLGMKALKQAGFKQIHVVEAQAQGNGDFPTVKSPNPEEVSAFDLAQKLGQDVGADILLATDPDADRLGAMIPLDDGEFQILTGNQIAVLMADYILKALQEKASLAPNGRIVKSIVSTDLVDAIAADYGIETKSVLTGFKYIAEQIKQYETSGDHEFIMGFEESYGYLIKPFVRDKDAIQALLLLAEMVVYHKKAGRTLPQVLENIYQKYGYFQEVTVSKVFEGQAGKDQMAEIMSHIRQTPVNTIAGIEVTDKYDYLNQIHVDGQGQESSLTEPKSDALKYCLADGSWLAFRPSGTEPKIKLYYGIKAGDRQSLAQKAKEISQAIDHLVAV